MSLQKLLEYQNGVDEPVGVVGIPPGTEVVVVLVLIDDIFLRRLVGDVSVSIQQLPGKAISYRW